MCGGWGFDQKHVDEPFDTPRGYRTTTTMTDYATWSTGRNPERDCISFVVLAIVTSKERKKDRKKGQPELGQTVDGPDSACTSTCRLGSHRVPSESRRVLAWPGRAWAWAYLATHLQVLQVLQALQALQTPMSRGSMLVGHPYCQPGLVSTYE